VNKWVIYGLWFAGGVILANRVRALPGLSKLPSI